MLLGSGGAGEDDCKGEGMAGTETYGRICSMPFVSFAMWNSDNGVPASDSILSE